MGKIFFSPSRVSEGREEPAGGGEWWEPQGAAGEGRREPVVFPEHLGAGSASRRLAGTCLLDEPVLEAPEVPGSSGALPALPGFSLRAPVRAGAPMTGRRELCLRWHQCGCEMGMSVYLCVNVSLGLCRGTVSFSETHLATLHRPEPPRCSGGTVMTSVAGLCLCALGKENRCFGVCDPPQAPRLFWQSPGDSGGGGCQFCLGGFQRESSLHPRSPEDPPWSHRDALAGFFQNSTCQTFLCPKGDTLVQVGHTVILCMCTCARSYPTNHSPLLLLLSAHRQSPHCQTSILPSAKAFPAI